MKVIKKMTKLIPLYRLTSIHSTKIWCLILLCIYGAVAQSEFPRRSEWRSPDGSLPISYEQWKTSWDAQPKLMGGSLVYRTPSLGKVEIDSFVFGRDYAYFKDYVRHADGSLCKDLPPQASFVVLLNGSDRKILTDDAPRWSFGDPNISGMGWFGIELGNFNEPEVAIGDTFQITFSCYPPGESPQQGSYSKQILGFPFVAWPSNLYLSIQLIPSPPANLRLQREGTANKLNWVQVSGQSYIVYRRSLNDTLARNFPRFQYEKIADGIVDSCYIDTQIDTLDRYGYLLFARDLSSGAISGRSRDICESESGETVRAIIVQPELYSAIQNNLLRLAADWETEAEAVLIYAMQFPSAEALRDTLRHIKGLKGALLIGNFPVPWFQFCDPDGSNYQEYPADLYFMDLDGIWEDNLYKPASGPMLPGSDGIYDTHYDDYPRTTQKPEIVIGRITPTPGMGDPEEVINNYLDKVYNYRHDLYEIRQQFKALAYPDDDWSTWGNDIATLYLSQVYPEYLCIYDINTTTATDYRARLNDHYSLLHVWVHSWSGGHAFKVNNGTQNEWFYNYQILPSGSNANFYQLFACSNSRYVEDLNCAGIYAYLTSTGINTIGSTHSGGMLHFDYFYTQLSRGMSFGEAFLKTFQYVGDRGFTLDMRGWYYGLTFNGDPYVVPQSPTVNSITPLQPSPIVKNYELSNYPNPFNSSTRIVFNLPRSVTIDLSIYNVLGERVRCLQKGYVLSGKHQLYWDGRNDKAEPLPAGIYLCSLRNENQIVKSKKIILLP